MQVLFLAAGKLVSKDKNSEDTATFQAPSTYQELGITPIWLLYHI